MKQLRLTEQEFNDLIRESVYSLLKEYGDRPENRYMMGRVFGNQSDEGDLSNSDAIQNRDGFEGMKDQMMYNKMKTAGKQDQANDIKMQMDDKYRMKRRLGNVSMDDVHVHFEDE